MRGSVIPRGIIDEETKVQRDHSDFPQGYIAGKEQRVSRA